MIPLRVLKIGIRLLIFLLGTLCAHIGVWRGRYEGELLRLRKLLQVWSYTIFPFDPSRSPLPCPLPTSAPSPSPSPIPHPPSPPHPHPLPLPSPPLPSPQVLSRPVPSPLLPSHPSHGTCPCWTFATIRATVRRRVRARSPLLRRVATLPRAPCVRCGVCCRDHRTSRPPRGCGWRSQRRALPSSLGPCRSA